MAVMIVSRSPDQLQDLAMILENYGVKLTRLTEADIEMVRTWRNDPKIQQYMAFRDHITRQMQKRWFTSINNANNYFFIIHYENCKAGMVEIKRIDYSRKSGHSGIFIYEDKYLNTPLGYRANVIVLDFAFGDLDLDFIYAQILKSNPRAQRFHRAMGFCRLQGQKKLQLQLYTLDRQSYYQRTRSLQKKLKR